MTNGEFIIDQMRAYGVTEGDMMIIKDDVTLDAELNVADAEKAMIALIAKAAVAPYQKSINENGFSVSWDMDGLGRWYLWLCRKYGVTPDYSLVPGISSVIEISDIW